jgi:hypothetical protein
MQPAPTDSGSGPMKWILIGCGGLFVVVTCCGGAGAAFFVYSAQRTRTAVEEARAQAMRNEEEQDRMDEERRLAEGLPPEPGDPLAANGPVPVTMTVTSVDGVSAVTVGTVCNFAVEMKQMDDGPACQAHVVCAGRALYGDEDTNGYFPCTLTASSVVGADTGTTASDTDPAFSIDTNAGTISISDDSSGRLGAFHVTATAIAGTVGLGLIAPGAAS